MEKINEKISFFGKVKNFLKKPAVIKSIITYICLWIFVIIFILIKMWIDPEGTKETFEIIKQKFY